MSRQNLTVILLGLAIFGSIAWYLLSQPYAMSQLREAALAGDTAALNEQVDFPAFRESLKSELRAQLDAEMEKRKGRDDPLTALGGMIALGMMDSVIDGLVTPEGIGAMIAHGRIDGGSSMHRGSGQAMNWKVERKGVNTFHAVSAGGGGDAPSLVFERNGFGWKLVGITFEREEDGID